MTTNDLLEALARLRVETGSLACLGCGREHNCSTHGCQILREAAAQLEHFTAENRALRNALATKPTKRSASIFTTAKTNRLFGRSSGSAGRRATGRT